MNSRAAEVRRGGPRPWELCTSSMFTITITTIIISTITYYYYYYYYYYYTGNWSTGLLDYTTADADVANDNRYH